MPGSAPLSVSYSKRLDWNIFYVVYDKICPGKVLIARARIAVADAEHACRLCGLCAKCRVLKNHTVTRPHAKCLRCQPVDCRIRLGLWQFLSAQQLIKISTDMKPVDDKSNELLTAR